MSWFAPLLAGPLVFCDDTLQYDSRKPPLIIYQFNGKFRRAQDFFDWPGQSQAGAAGKLRFWRRKKCRTVRHCSAGRNLLLVNTRHK
jgi:hypothetical protein